MYVLGIVNVYILSTRPSKIFPLDGITVAASLYFSSLLFIGVGGGVSSLPHSTSISLIHLELTTPLDLKKKQNLSCNGAPIAAAVTQVWC